MTAGELHDRLSLIGADLMVRALGALERESLTLQAQPEEGVTYAAKIDKAEARIDWSKPAKDVHNTIRGISPFPGAGARWKSTVSLNVSNSSAPHWARKRRSGNYT